MSEFGDELGRLRRARGLSLHELARRSHYDVGYLSKLANGHRTGSQDLARQLDRLLHADGQLVAAWEATARPPIPAVPSPSLVPDPDLYERITRAVDQPQRVDQPVVEWLEHTLDEHRRVEDTIGARPLLGLIRSQLTTVAGLIHSARGPLAGRLIGLSSEYAQFLAWMCMDVQDHAAALAWYDRAHDWAQEAGDPNMAATTLSMKAHQAWSTGDPRRCVRMAQAARWSSQRVTPGVQGMAAQMEARGHALAGDADPARSLLDQAQALIDRAARTPGDEPPWMYFYSDDWFQLQRGMAELHLGNWPAAAQLLTAGLDALPESYRRDRAWYGACLASAHAGAGEAEQAAAVALRFAADIAALNRYARRELLAAAETLDRARAPQARVIRETLLDHPS